MLLNYSFLVGALVGSASCRPRLSACSVPEAEWGEARAVCMQGPWQPQACGRQQRTIFHTGTALPGRTPPSPHRGGTAVAACVWWGSVPELLEHAVSGFCLLACLLVSWLLTHIKYLDVKKFRCQASQNLRSCVWSSLRWCACRSGSVCHTELFPFKVRPCCCRWPALCFCTLYLCLHLLALVRK